MVKHEPWSSMSHGGVKRRGLSVIPGIYVPDMGATRSARREALYHHLPVHRRSASKITNAPGMTTANTTRRTARGRSCRNDSFVIVGYSGGQGARGPSIGGT